PGRDEQGRLLAEQPGDALLQAVDGRVLAEDVVADLRGGHGGAHARRRTGGRVAAEVDPGGGHVSGASLWWLAATFRQALFADEAAPFVPSGYDEAGPFLYRAGRHPTEPLSLSSCAR